MTMQLVRDLKSEKKGSRSSRHHAETSSQSSNSSGSSSGKPSKKNHAGKAVENFEAAKRRMRRRPLHYVRKYVRMVERELGAEDRPFRVSELGRKVNWGKQKTLQRCHYMLSETLELMLKEKWEKAALQLVLNLKAIHQTALDGGDWSVGWMLTHLADPFTKQRFGGDPEELGHVTAYLKSMADLEKHSEKLRASMPWSGQTFNNKGSEADKKKKKPKGKGKGNKTEEEKSET